MAYRQDVLFVIGQYQVWVSVPPVENRLVLSDGLWLAPLQSFLVDISCSSPLMVYNFSVETVFCSSSPSWIDCIVLHRPTVITVLTVLDFLMIVQHVYLICKTKRIKWLALFLELIFSEYLSIFHYFSFLVFLMLWVVLIITDWLHLS